MGHDLPAKKTIMSYLSSAVVEKNKQQLDKWPRGAKTAINLLPYKSKHQLFFVFWFPYLLLGPLKGGNVNSQLVVVTLSFPLPPPPRGCLLPETRQSWQQEKSMP